MAIIFFTDDPAALKKSFEDAVKLGSKAGGITTWSVYSGNEYTHDGQFVKKATMTPVVQTDSLKFAYKLRAEGSAKEIKLIRAYYHGHILQTIMDHFYDQFTHAHFEKPPVAAKASPTGSVKKLIITTPPKPK